MIQTKTLLKATFSLGAALIAFSFAPVFAYSFWPSTSPWIKGKAGVSQVRLINSNGPVSLQAHSRHLLGIEFKLAKDWHVYWKNPGDQGFAPKPQWTLSEGWSAENLLFPTPRKLKSEGLGTIFGYSDSVIYPVWLTAAAPKAGALHVSLDLDYLVCKIQCVPERAHLELAPLVISAQEFAAPKSTENERLQASLNQLPQPGEAEAKILSGKRVQLKIQSPDAIEDLFLYSSVNKLKGANINRVGPNEFSIELSSELKDFEWTASIANKPGLSGSFQVQAPPPEPSMTLWLALLFAFLGGAILNLMPCVLPVVVLKTIGLMKLGSSRKSEIRRSLVLTISGILTSFAALASVFLIFRSIGLEVGWGFHFQSPTFVAIMALLIFIFAMNLFDVFEFQLPGSATTKLVNQSQGPFLEGVFATLLATPCSAPFLGTALTFALTQSPALLIITLLTMGLGLSVPYLILIASPQALRFFPRPGHWMKNLKRILGYSLLVAVIWLLWILQQQVGLVVWIAALICFLSAFIVLREFRGIYRLVFLALVGLSFIFGAQTFPPDTDRAIVSSQTFSPLELNRRLEAGETIFLVVTADWCLTCHYNETFVMKTEWFHSLITEHNVSEWTLDWTNRSEVIASFLKDNNRVGIPFSMLISKDKKVLLPELLTESNVRDTFNSFFKDGLRSQP